MGDIARHLLLHLTVLLPFLVNPGMKVRDTFVKMPGKDIHTCKGCKKQRHDHHKEDKAVGKLPFIAVFDKHGSANYKECEYRKHFAAGIEKLS